MRAGLVCSTFAALACLAPAGPAGTEVSPPRAAADLRLALSLPEEAPRAGTPLTLGLDAVNEGDAPLVLDFPDGQRYDFEVFAEDGTRVWRWSDGMFFIQVLGRETVAPGDSLRWSERIEGGLPAGAYRVVATLTTVAPDTAEGALTVRPEADAARRNGVETP